jgi:hypothetical protein
LKFLKNVTRSNGTNICSCNIQLNIDKAFQNNYNNCYSIEIGQGGLNFIKPNKSCRKAEVIRIYIIIKNSFF